VSPCLLFPRGRMLGQRCRSLRGLVGRRDHHLCRHGVSRRRSCFTLDKNFTPFSPRILTRSIPSASKSFSLYDITITKLSDRDHYSSSKTAALQLYTKITAKYRYMAIAYCQAKRGVTCRSSPALVMFTAHVGITSRFSVTIAVM
jgi:hypothetical protein